MFPARITSRQNPHYKHIKALSSSAKTRREEGLTLLEGVHVCEAYVQAGFSPRLVVVSDSALQNTEVAAIIEKIEGVEVLNLPDDLFAGISVVENGVGVAFVAEAPTLEPVSGVSGDALFIDGVQDPGNVGALLRTVAGAGVGEVYLSANSASAWSPKALRAGMGAQFNLKVYENVNLPALAREATVPVTATSLQAKEMLYEKNLTGPRVWVFGSEGAGVSEELLGVCTDTVIIPQESSVESLNVAASAAVCLFEQRRQRLGGSVQ